MMTDSSEPSRRLLKGPRSYRSLLLGFVVAVFALGFLSLTVEVLEGDTGVIDAWVANSMQALRDGHPRLGEVMRDLSGLGSTVVLTLVVVTTAGYLLVVRRVATSVMVIASASLGAMAVSAMKGLFGRSRPDHSVADFVVNSLSFPSGHATMSAAVYLTLGALLAGTRVRWRERAYILGAAALLTVAVGLSRIVLSVHWATDVLAGWAFGSAWAALWLLVATHLESPADS